jgi:hypothetical protein
MKVWHKRLLAIGSHWFLIYIPIFIVAAFTLIASAPKHQGSDAPIGFIAGMGCVLLVHFVSIFSILALQVVYIIFVAKHPRFDEGNSRVMWILLLFFFGIITMPILYWMYVHKHPIGEPFFGVAK